MIDVTDHGADPTGERDSSDAFQAAIDAAAEHRGAVIPDKVVRVRAGVRVPPGEYRIGRSLRLPTGVAIGGTTVASCTLRFEGEGPCLDLRGETEKFATSVRELTLIGNPNSGSAIDARLANRAVIVESCFITGFESGVRLYDCYTPCIRDCVIWNNRRDGIEILDGHNVTLLNNRIENADRHGIYVSFTPTNAGTALTFYGNVCQGNACAGYCFEGVSQFFMAGNFAEGNNRRGDGWAAVHVVAHADVRNISMAIEGMYITAGWTTADDSTGVHVEQAQLVSLRDVHVRSNGKIGRGVHLGEGVELAIVDNCHFQGVPEGLVVDSPLTTIQHTPHVAAERRLGKVFQGPGYETTVDKHRRIGSLQLHAGRQGAGFVGVGSYDQRPAIQAYGAGSGFALRLNPKEGRVAVGDVTPTAKLDVDGSARVRGDAILDGGWDSGRLRLGDLYLWAEGGQLRMRRGLPRGPDDGAVVGSIEAIDFAGQGRDGGEGTWQLRAGAPDAGHVGVGSVGGQPAIQGMGPGSSFQLRLNPEGGRVGIGALTPTAALDVDGGARFRGGDVLLDGGRLRFGAHYLWVDEQGDLRIKRGVPHRDRDGRPVAEPSWWRRSLRALKRGLRG